MFTKNVGNVDRLLRIAIGIVLIAVAVGLLGDTGYNLWGWIGAVPLLTGLFGNCPLYSVLGLSTCSTNQL